MMRKFIISLCLFMLLAAGLRAQSEEDRRDFYKETIPSFPENAVKKNKVGKVTSIVEMSDGNWKSEENITSLADWERYCSRNAILLFTAEGKVGSEQSSWDEQMILQNFYQYNTAGIMIKRRSLMVRESGRDNEDMHFEEIFSRNPATGQEENRTLFGSSVQGIMSCTRSADGKASNIKVTNAQGKDMSSQYTFDDHGKVIATTLSASRTQYLYDKDGRVIQQEALENGRILSRKAYAYDAQGRMLSCAIYLPGDKGSELALHDKVEYTYDAQGNVAGKKVTNTPKDEPVPTDTAYPETPRIRRKKKAALEENSYVYVNTYSPDGLLLKRELHNAADNQLLIVERFFYEYYR